MQEKIMHRLWHTLIHTYDLIPVNTTKVEITTARVVNEFIYRTKCWSAIHAAHRSYIHIWRLNFCSGNFICDCSVIKAELLFKCTYLLRIVHNTLFAALLVTTPIINAHIILKAPNKKRSFLINCAPFIEKQRQRAAIVLSVSLEFM